MYKPSKIRVVYDIAIPALLGYMPIHPIPFTVLKTTQSKELVASSAQPRIPGCDASLSPSHSGPDSGLTVMEVYVKTVVVDLL